MIYKVDNYPIDKITKIPIEKRKRGNQRTKDRRRYRSVLCAFDIETTRIPEIEQAVMYVWQFQIGNDTIIGRTWIDFLDFVDALQEQLGDDFLVVYVHNLSYEFQFLAGIYDFAPEDVFIIRERKILKAVMKCLEFRCSYLQSNMNLAELTRRMHVEHEKQGNFDYTKTRWPWTPLTDSEMKYIIHDVAGLVEAMRVRIYGGGDNLYTVPLTSTGYVRREARRAMRHFNKERLSRMLPDLELFIALREAFRGGNTHANRYYSGQILKGVKSMDEASAYPFEEMTKEVPMGPWWRHENPTIDDIIKMMDARAMVFRIALFDVRLKQREWGCPYIARAKCRNVYNGYFDNGRILSTDYLETTVTDVDFRIILEEYEFSDCMVFDLWSARYGKMPAPLRGLNNEYYKRKTELKGVSGEEDAYMRAKELLNSIYGMSVQNPCKQNIKYIKGEYIEENEPLESLLATANRKAFQSYAWGVWITAWARYNLEEGIKLAGSGFVYCDTDSVKYIGDVDFSELNKRREKESKEAGAYASDPAGHVHYMGVFEHDASYEEFITLGAKKYAYKEDGKIHITIAGVGKHLGAVELEKAGGLSAFKEGFEFKEINKLESVYNDIPPMNSYEVDGHLVPITRNIVLRPISYTLGITGEYSRLLENPDIF